jgi:ActR/RegA family two-component response regulator
LATLITPYGREFSVTPQDLNAGFTKSEMDQLIQGECKAFRLKTGDLLLVDALACNPRTIEKNEIGTRWLRNAISDPGGEVCGYALLLAQEELDSISPSEKTELFLDRRQEALTLLLLDRNEEFRSVMALGLERAQFRVIQARTAAEALAFCESHRIEILVADVSSLRPQTMQTLGYIQEAQPQAKVLLVSGYDAGTVAAFYPGLLMGVEFMQKPFELNVLANTAHWMVGTNKTSQPHDILVAAKTASG